MPVDDKLLKDINNHLMNLAELKDWLSKVYYNEAFSGLFQKPVISMMITGCEYLKENITKLRTKYLSHFEDITTE